MSLVFGCGLVVNGVNGIHLAWSTQATHEPAIDLKTAGDYVILAKSGITSVPSSVITGDIAVSPIDSTAMTGFSFTLDPSGTFSESIQLAAGGRAYAANYNTPVPAQLTVAVLDMETAYTNAAGRLNPDAARINLGGGTLGGAFGGEAAPLTPGVYTFVSSVSITSTLYLDGDDSDVFIIQMTGNLMLAANTQVLLSNGTLARNVFWQVAGNIQVFEGAHLVGILLVKTDATFLTGSSLLGRVLTQTACNLQMTTIDGLVGLVGSSNRTEEDLN